MEHSQEAALQAELSLVQAEEAALPLKISKLQEALQLEHADLQRREQGVNACAALPAPASAAGIMFSQLSSDVQSSDRRKQQDRNH